MQQSSTKSTLEVTTDCYHQHQTGRRGGKEQIDDQDMPPRVGATQIGSKKIEFQLELRNGFETLRELDDTDTMNEANTDMI